MKNNYITMWTLSSILERHNQTLYNWINKNPINPNFGDKNHFKFYSIPKLKDWLIQINQPVSKLIDYENHL